MAGLAIDAVLIGALAVLAASVALRSRSGGQWEIRLSDLAIALVPLLVWMALTGRLKELKLGGEGFSAVFQQAAASKVAPAVTALPVTDLVAGQKGGLPELDQMIGKQAQELVFVLGSHDYDPGMARYWLDHLTRYPFFRFVVLQQNGGAFFGMFDARTLATALAQGSGWSDFINQIAAGNTASLQRLRRLPGFVGADAAVNSDTDKEAVLRRMQQLRATTLPVTGSAGRLVGIVDQSSVLGSLVLDINARLKAM